MAAAHPIRIGGGGEFPRANRHAGGYRAAKRRCASWRNRHPALAWVVKPWRIQDVVSRRRPHVCLWCVAVTGLCLSFPVAILMQWPHIAFSLVEVLKWH